MCSGKGWMFCGCSSWMLGQVFIRIRTLSVWLTDWTSKLWVFLFRKTMQYLIYFVLNVSVAGVIAEDEKQRHKYSVHMLSTVLNSNVGTIKPPPALDFETSYILKWTTSRWHGYHVNILTHTSRSHTEPSTSVMALNMCLAVLSVRDCFLAFWRFWNDPAGHSAGRQANRLTLSAMTLTIICLNHHKCSAASVQ